MALATLEDVKRVLRAAPPSGVKRRISIGNSPTDSISEADAQKFIDAAEDELVLRIGYMPKPSKFVTELVAKMSACQIYSSVLMQSADGDVPEFIRYAVCGWAEEKLREIAEGTIVLPPETKGENIPLLVKVSSRVREVWWEEHVLLDDFVQLENRNLVPGTVQVGKTRGDFSDLYSEGVDFEVVLGTGEVRRLKSGSIPRGEKVFISYSYIDMGTYWLPPSSIDSKLRGERGYLGD